MKELSVFMFFWSWIVALIGTFDKNNGEVLTWILAMIGFAIVYAGTVIAEAIKAKK